MTVPIDEHDVDIEEARRVLNDVEPGIEAEEGDPLHTHLLTAVREMQRLSLDINEIFDERFISTATGEELENLGNNVGVERRRGEADDSLRVRIRAGYAAAVSRGTYEDIAKVALLALDTEPSQVNIIPSRKTSDPATAIIETPTSVIDNTPLTETEVVERLSAATIGGHRITIQQTDVFTWDDANNSWGTEWGNTLQ